MTQLPWTYLPTREGDTVTHTILARDDLGNEHEVCEAYSEADARLIAAAVNMHAPVLAFLRWLRENSGEKIGDHPKAMAMLAGLLETTS